MTQFRFPRLHLSYIRFSLLFTAGLYIAANALNIQRIAQWFSDGDHTNLMGLSAYLLFGYGLFLAIFVLLAHRHTIKPLAILLLIVSAAASYFIAKYDIALDRSMLMNVLYTDSTEATGLLSWQMLPYLLLMVVLPTIIISFIRIDFPRGMAHLGQTLLVFFLALAIGISMVYLEYDSIHRAGNQSKKNIIHQLVPVNLILSGLSAVQRSAEAWVKSHREPVVIKGRIEQPRDLVVVLAIGESSRQKSFSLYGYKRKQTNPLLSQYPDLEVLNGVARIGSTLLALPQILEKDGIKLVKASSALGVDTSCFVNYTLYDNCDAVGEARVKNCGHGGKCYDEDVIPLLKDSLSRYKSGQKLVVLHIGGGSHGPTYRDRYPPEFQVFNPQCLDADVVNQCTPYELYNSYDNTILYVDYVVDGIIKTLDESSVPYVMIYLSDHGESLLEGGRVFHGMPPGIKLPAEQAHIPLLVKSSVPISIEARDEYTQPDVFDTILDLLSLKVDNIKQKAGFVRMSK